jgi:hypothetical protein
MVISEGQERVLRALEEKTHKAIDLYQNLVDNANGKFFHKTKGWDKKVELPGFL